MAIRAQKVCGTFEKRTPGHLNINVALFWHVRCMAQCGHTAILCELKVLKWYYDQKNNSFFSLDFKTMLNTN